MQFIAFFLVVLLLTGMSWMLVGAVLWALIPGGWSTIAATWALSVAPLFVLVRHYMTRSYPSAAVRVWVFRAFWYAQLLMLALAFVSGLSFIAGLPFGAAEAVARMTVLIAAAALVALGFWGYAGSRRLVVRELRLTPRDLPAALDGLRIVQLSDLHVGPQTPRAYLERIAAATRDARPHLIAYTGDQVDDHPADVSVFVSAFGHLTAPLGVFAIPGNHDVYAGWSEVRRRLSEAGIAVLVNESVRIEHNRAAFWLAGTGDPSGLYFGRGAESGAPDIARTLSGVPPNGFCVVLAHDPRLFPALAQARADVVLSGHTHHGQFSIPSRQWSLASVFLEYAMGSYERNGALLYVSPGTNYWGIPFRIGALPEITVITLASGAAEPAGISSRP